MLSSIRIAVASLEAAITHAILLPVDHPGVRRSTVDALLSEARAHPEAIVLPTYQGGRGHPVILPRALFAEILAAPDDEGARAVVRVHPDRVRAIAVDSERMKAKFGRKRKA